ncbi:MAG: alpha/beta hydrolase, partial [Clostridiales bacterium]|nr:alpha/beta hydrolase [Clostridiales bacterium]
MVNYRIIMPRGDAPPTELPSIVVEGARKFKDIVYSDAHRANRLDIYLPEAGTGPFPTIIFIHGGAFRAGSKDDIQIAIVIDALNRGYAVVSVEQRLTPTGIFPYPVFDYKAAIRFLRANADVYMLDEKRFVTAGTSAGGYYAVLAGATGGIAAFEDLSMGNPDVSSDVAAAMGFFGVYDLVMQSEFTNERGPFPEMPAVLDFAADFLGIDPREHRELAAFADPTSYITPHMVPTLIQAGSADDVVPTAASVALAEKIAAVCGGDRVQLDILE